MSVKPNRFASLAWFTPRPVEGPNNASWVVFLDPNPEPPVNIFERVAQTFERYQEVSFGFQRYALVEGYRRLGKDCPCLQIPDYGAPNVVRCVGRNVHQVFAATLPPAWMTGQVRSYALSSDRPTVTYGILAHRWLTDLGPTESNRILWPSNAS